MSYPIAVSVLALVVCKDGPKVHLLAPPEPASLAPLHLSLNVDHSIEESLAATLAKCRVQPRDIAYKGILAVVDWTEKQGEGRAARYSYAFVVHCEVRWSAGLSVVEAGEGAFDGLLERAPWMTKEVLLRFVLPLKNPNFNQYLPKTYGLEFQRFFHKILHHIVVFVIIIEGDNIVLIKEPVSKGGGWYFPAGHAENFESIHEAVKRETKEEAGLDIEPLELLHTIYDEGRIWDFVYSARITGGSFKTIPDEESQGAAWFNLKSVREDVLDPVKRKNFRNPKEISYILSQVLDEKGNLVQGIPMYHIPNHSKLM